MIAKKLLLAFSLAALKFRNSLFDFSDLFSRSFMRPCSSAISALISGCLHWRLHWLIRGQVGFLQCLFWCPVDGNSSRPLLVWGPLRAILGFHQSVIKTKNRNHSVNKVKTLGYDWLIYKHSRQEPGFCSFSFARYLQKCVTKIYRALYGDAMFVSFWAGLFESRLTLTQG